MSKVVFSYPNYSKGGVSAVLRGRAGTQPDVSFYGLFEKDGGGAGVYENYSNIHSRVVQKSRMPAYSTYVSNEFELSEICVLSNPASLTFWKDNREAILAYEFHSSDMSVLKSELDELDMSRVDEVRVPSNFMANRLLTVCSSRVSNRLTVVPNLVDNQVFNEAGETDFFDRGNLLNSGQIPLVWVGRFDKGKGFTQFLRSLAALPEEYVGMMVVSLESDSSRLINCLTEARSLGVGHRIKVLSDLSPQTLSLMFRSARDLGGMLVSTSLLESFGYAVAEALACALPVRAFELPVWTEHVRFQELGVQVPIGDVRALAEAVLASD